MLVDEDHQFFLRHSEAVSRFSIGHGTGGEMQDEDAGIVCGMLPGPETKSLPTTRNQIASYRALFRYAIVWHPPMAQS